jgi:hypothetical protein
MLQFLPALTTSGEAAVGIAGFELAVGTVDAG